MDKMARLFLCSAFTSVLAFVSLMNAAYADTGLGWFSCEAGESTPTKYVISSLFSFEYEYQASGGEDAPEKSASEMSAEEMADQIWADLVDQSTRSDSFGPQAQAALGARFQDEVRSQLAIACLTVPQAIGPYDARDEAETQQNIVESIHVNLRLEFDDVDLELVKIPFAP